MWPLVVSGQIHRAPGQERERACGFLVRSKIRTHRLDWSVKPFAAGAGQQERRPGARGRDCTALGRAGRSSPGSGRSWPGAQVWGDQGGWEGGAGRCLGRGLLLPAPRRPPRCSWGSVAAATAVDMEPPDAWARTRRAPRLLVLALLLGAHPGMLGLRAGREG